MNRKIRSPLFYVGDKYKLMPQLKKLFPNRIVNYYEPFVGGGSSFMNIKADRYILNDLNNNIINLHKFLLGYVNERELLFRHLFKNIKKYKLSCSYLNIKVPDDLKKIYVKTYYSKYNKQSYIKMRDDFNLDKTRIDLLYLLLIYGFNHMIRFNGKGEFNLPVGNVDFNNNVYTALNDYFDIVENNNIKFYSMDYVDFIKSYNYGAYDYIYLDPPYLISNSEYNKMWNDNNEKELYRLLDELNSKGIYFGLSNIVEHKGKINSYLNQWMNKYNVYSVKSNYISRFDNTVKKDSKEVFITNYG